MHFNAPININALPPTKRHTVHCSSSNGDITLQVNIYNNYNNIYAVYLLTKYNLYDICIGSCVGSYILNISSNATLIYLI